MIRKDMGIASPNVLDFALAFVYYPLEPMRLPIPSPPRTMEIAHAGI